MLACCCVCGAECIPLADYEMPVCIRCDDNAEMVLRRAEFIPSITPPKLMLDRPADTYYGAAAPEVIEELIAALNTPARPLPVHNGVASLTKLVAS